MNDSEWQSPEASAGDPRQGDTVPPPKNRLLQVGVFVVIGAVAANVFGFRHSRWAVGKDIHRAWERTNARRVAQQSANERKEPPSNRSPHPEWRGASASASSSNRVFEEFMRQAETFARDSEEQRERSRKPDVRSRARSWSDYRQTQSRGSQRTSNGSQGTTWQKTTRIDFDPSTLEELLRNLHRDGLQRDGSRRRTSLFNERVSVFDTFQELDKLLRAAQQSQAQDRRAAGHRGTGFEAEFWDEVFGAGFNEQQDGSKSQASSGCDPFASRTRSHDEAFAALGLKPGASKAELKTAYRREAMKYHPDTYSGSDRDDAARRFRDVTVAYNLLKDVP